LAGERQQFVQTLLQEIQLAALTPPFPLSGSASTIYFGGGTPSLHTAEEIDQLIKAVSQSWGIDASAEITLEANPGTLDREKLSGLRQAGVNRLSIGVQSFSPRKLSMLFRDHSVPDVYDAVELSRAAGFSNLSLDLIFGLPGESAAEWQTDLETALALKPEHISLYNLEYHDGTPFMRWRESGRFTPLSDDADADLYLLTHERLTAAGYEHYEISNFCRPGFRAVHNSAYWEAKPYLSFGPSAHSFDGRSTRHRNVSDLHRYRAEIEAGRLPIDERTTTSSRERREEWISLKLRRSEGISRGESAALWGTEATAALWLRAGELPAELRTVNTDQLALTPAGWFRENSVLLWLYEAPAESA
jgi:oxygen-independent coproporphyrinogen-3 oxidase